MKKLLGISIVAMLAVSPMMANAADTDPVTPNYTAPTHENTPANAPTTNADPAFAAVGITVGDQSHIASTAYVKGAYNSAIAAVNKVAANNTTSAGNGIAKSAAGAFSVNLTKGTGADANTNVSGLKLDGETDGSKTLSVDVDTSTIEINSSHKVGVKAGGITSTQLANNAVTSGKIDTGAVAFGNVASADIVTSTTNTNGIRATDSASDSLFVTEKAVAKALAAVATVADDAQTAQEVEDAIDAAAGAGLATNGSGVLSIDLKKGTGDVDASGLDLTGDKLAVNAGSGLNIGSTGALEAKVDNSTITVDNNGALQVGTITTSNIAAGSQQAPTATGTYTNSKLATAGYVDEKAAGLQTGTLATINASTVSIFTTWGSDDGTATNTVSVAAPNSYVAQ